VIACHASAPQGDSSVRVTPSAVPAASATGPIVGQPFFLDGGAQAMLCENGTPPMPIDKASTSATCWYAGTSCAGHGELVGEPFTLAGAVVAGETQHGGCNPSQYALVYERDTSPLRLRVCAKTSPPVDCPATLRDGARWDVGPLLEANHAKAATLVTPQRASSTRSDPRTTP